ncbi:coiled-coil domain-containing protein-domain-containing protein [Xylariaceae sp. FL1019]|nr:coiled-coil domain-containing protein-domain-containing protein [Xylariaceae sp. FL1019]
MPSDPILPYTLSLGKMVTPISSTTYEKPQPRPPKAPAHAAKIRVRNRRREWLTRNQSYFQSLEHELADPVLYDKLVRRFQSHEQREQEGRVKGFGRVLEVDLLRGEARMKRLAEDVERTSEIGRSAAQNGDEKPDMDATRTRRDAEQPEVVDEVETYDLDKPPPQDAEEGRSRWNEYLRRRFVAGRDDDFNYRTVDEDDEYDTLERREQEDAWIENEEPSWIEEDEDQQAADGHAEKVVERPLVGETGVQDF